MQTRYSALDPTIVPDQPDKTLSENDCPLDSRPVVRPYPLDAGRYILMWTSQVL